MRFMSSHVAGALLVSQAVAHPVGLGKRQDDIDTTVLQFALTVGRPPLPVPGGSQSNSDLLADTC